jgi:hypothetical protein
VSESFLHTIKEKVTPVDPACPVASENGTKVAQVDGTGVQTKQMEKSVENTPAYNMMQGTRRIYSGLTWHVTSLPQTNEKRNA